MSRIPSSVRVPSTPVVHVWYNFLCSSLTDTGDKSSALGFLGDICQPDGSQRDSYYLVPRTSKKTKNSEDLSYLRSKGAFSVPSEELCDELICSYFRHVHPLVPIVDAQSFLHQYLEHGYQNVNLLLLWSMFFAAANVSIQTTAGCNLAELLKSVEPHVLQNSGYQTRKAMKRAMYQRAKVSRILMLSKNDHQLLLCSVCMTVTTNQTNCPLSSQ